MGLMLVHMRLGRPSDEDVIRIYIYIYIYTTFSVYNVKCQLNIQFLLSIGQQLLQWHSPRMHMRLYIGLWPFSGFKSHIYMYTQRKP